MKPTDQAFPSQHTVIEKENFEGYRSDGRTETRIRDVEKVVVNNGVDLRTYLAGKAMSAVIGNSDSMRELTRAYEKADKRNRPSFFNMVAFVGVEYADALIVELNKVK